MTDRCPLCGYDASPDVAPSHWRQCMNTTCRLPYNRWPAVQALKDRVKELEAWKKSAMEVHPPVQEIAKELSIPLGESIHDKILPGIQKLKNQIEELEKQLQDRSKSPDDLEF